MKSEQQLMEAYKRLGKALNKLTRELQLAPVEASVISTKLAFDYACACREFQQNAEAAQLATNILTPPTPRIVGANGAPVESGEGD